MRARLNLATKALATRRRFLVGAGLLGAVAGILALVLGWHVYAVRKANENLRARTEKTQQEMFQLEQKRARLDAFFKLPENAKLHDRAAFLNALIDERSFNWTQMFMDLEKIMPGGVRVVSIEPRQAKGHVEVKLTVGATNDESKLKFLRALESSPAFTQVRLESEHAPQHGEAGDQEVMELTVVYSRT